MFNRIEAILKLAAQIEPTWPKIVATSELSNPATLQARVADPPKADKKLRDRLKEIDSDIASKRDERAEAQTEVDAAKGKLADQEKIDTKSDDFQAAKAARGKLGGIDEEIAALQSEKVDILEMVGGSDPELNAARAANSDRLKGGDRPQWDSSRMFESQETREALARIARSSKENKFGGMNLGEVADRDTLAADVTGSDALRRGSFYGVLPQLFRPLRVLDLIPTATMDGDKIPYAQEFGDFDAGVAETAEADQKPQSGVTYEDADADAKTIATWMKIRKQVLADIPALRGIIDTRLRYMVLRRLEKQVLNGNGSGENLEGILQTDGLGDAGGAPNELIGDAILDGLTEVLVADAEANAAILNPYDWRDTLKAKAAGGDEQYYSGGPFRATPESVWGTALVPSIAIPRGTALVGDFMIGAQLFIREGVQVLLSDSDQDDFIRNKITMLGEMRAALAVWRPSAFVVVDLGTSGS